MKQKWRGQKVFEGMTPYEGQLATLLLLPELPLGILGQGLRSALWTSHFLVVCIKENKRMG